MIYSTFYIKNLHGIFIQEKPCPVAGTVMMPVSDFRTTLDRLHACSGVCLLIYLGVPKKHALMSVLNIMFRFSLINDTSSQMISIGTALAYRIIIENVSGKAQKERANMETYRW